MDLIAAQLLLFGEVRNGFKHEAIEAAFDKKVRLCLDSNDYARITTLSKAREALLSEADLRLFNGGSTEDARVAQVDEDANVIKYLKSTQKNVFITGRAGTGKSHLLRQIREQFARSSVAVVAPTGVAALNVAGETIHKFFGFQGAVFIQEPSWLLSTSPKILAKLAALELLIIDEISMVRVDLIDAIDKLLKKSKKNLLPFGGVRVFMFGDVLQLPPVVDSKTKDAEILNSIYSTFWFFSARVWHEFTIDFEIIELHEVKRQQGDPRFVKLLSDIRVGDKSNADFPLLNSRVGVSSRSPHPLRIVPTKGQVVEINTRELAQIEAESLTYSSSRDVLTREPFNFDRDMPAEDHLSLKPGAQVIFVKNDDQVGEGNLPRWVNGTLGQVTAVTKLGPIVRIADNEPVLVRPSTWDYYNYIPVEIKDPVTEKIKNVLKPVVVARFTQIPLAAAWAITIHKSQGNTYDDLIVDNAKRPLRFPGQLYVALSRVREIDGLVLTGKVFPADLVVDHSALHFLSSRTKLRAAELRVAEQIPLIKKSISVASDGD